MNQSSVRSDTYPFVSIIMPVRNEEKYIERSLVAVLEQDYPSDRMEIVITDGMSTDSTREIINRLIQGRENILVIDNPNKIVAPGLNLGIKITKGEIIIRVDGHCVIASDYVRKCVKYLLSEPIVGVGGPLETIGETQTAETIALAMSTPFGVGGSAFRTVKDRSMYVETIPFPAYWREDVNEAGPFDEKLVRNQDDEYNFRLRSRGGKLLLAPDLKSKYYSRSSVKSVWRQYYQYGFYKVRVMQKHFQQMRFRQFIPAMFIGGIVGTVLLSLIWKPGWIFFAGLLCSYIVLNLFYSISTAAKTNWRHLFLLPLIFSVLHVSYGLGFWIGLIKFSINWRQFNRMSN